MTSFAVLASGRGSNFEAILHAIDRGILKAKAVVLLSDQPQAPVLEKAKKAGIPTLFISSQGLSREQHDEKVLEGLRPYSPEFLVLAGYMRVITPKLIEAFRDSRGFSRIVNIHPALLPAFRGLNGYAQAFEYGCKQAGVTVHLVEKELDAGPICAQESFSIADCKSVEEVERLGLELEHQLYPATLQWLLKGQFQIEHRGTNSQRRLCVRSS